MNRAALRLLSVAAVLAVGAPSRCSMAAQTPAAAPPGRASVQTPLPAPSVARDAGQQVDASQTRSDLRALLERHPPSVARVLRLDPALLTSESYLQTYPELAAFLDGHPEVRRDPGYFLGPSEAGRFEPMDARGQAMAVWQDLFEGVSVFTVMLTIILSFLWCLRTLLDHRRWGRLQRVQTDVHSKILDRLAATDDLLKYMQTPAGRRFLESAPIALDGATRAPSAPLGRILWSVQVGLVLAAGGLGLQFVSGRVPDEMTSPLFAVGMLALSLGVGFVLAAGVSFLVTRRLGLLAPAPAAPDHGGQG
jgi:hypothetical protein